MLKVMLIDDEQNILTGLRYLIDWNAQGFEICGAYQNAKQALESAPKLRPDLIITDIEMPGTSGLDLIAALREELPKSLFAILSAYEDFRYAKRAVELGAYRYLLKPLPAEELTGLLAAVKKHFSNSDSVDTEMSVFRNFVVREVVLSGLELCHAASIPYYKDLMDETNLQLVLVNLLLADGTPMPVSEAMPKVQELFCPHSIFTTGDSIAMLLKADPMITAADMKAKLGPCMAEVSDVFAGLAAAHPRYEQLVKHMQDNLFWAGWQKTAVEGTVPELPDETTTAYLRRAIWYCDKVALESAFEDILEKISHCAGSMTKNDVIRIYDEMFKIAGSLLQNISAYNPIHQTADLRFFDCQTLSQMHACALKEFYTILDAVRDLTSDSSLNLIRQAKAHIMDHYSEADFRLTDIADALYVNYSYLSNLFKQETGDTLSNYLLKQRMKRAKELLTDPILTVAEISQRVGYHNVKTFYSTFKKYYNESPRSYQQRNAHRKF